MLSNPVWEHYEVKRITFYQICVSTLNYLLITFFLLGCYAKDPASSFHHRTALAFGLFMPGCIFDFTVKR